MKLKLHSFDFGENLLTFSVPMEIMHTNRWGNVPGGVEVDVGAITGNAALGIKELAATDSQQLQAKIAARVEVAIRCLEDSCKEEAVQQLMEVKRQLSAMQ